MVSYYGDPSGWGGHHSPPPCLHPEQAEPRHDPHEQVEHHPHHLVMLIFPLVVTVIIIAITFKMIMIIT